MVRPNPISFPSRSLLRLGLVIIAVSAFFLAVQLMGEAMRTLSPVVRPLLLRHWPNDAQMVGISWLAAYAMLNGSAVAAIVISLFSVGVFDVSELFLLVAGSRLGAAGIVLLIGGLDFLRADEYSLPEAMRLGTLTFIVSHTIYVPATVAGTIVIHWAGPDVWRSSVDVSVQPNGVINLDPFITTIVRLFGTVPSLMLALLLIIGSVHLLDRLIEGSQTNRLRIRVFVFLRRRWLSFGLGLAITAVGTSIAFSMGVIVPIYNRGYIDRSEIVPYIMGASLGTLTDTLIVAVVLGSSAGIAIVLLLFVVAAIWTGVALIFYDSYYAIVGVVQERLLQDRRAFGAFLASLIVVPLVLILIPY